MPFDRHDHMSPPGLVVRTGIIFCFFVASLAYEDEFVHVRDALFAPGWIDEDNARDFAILFS